MNEELKNIEIHSPEDPDTLMPQLNTERKPGGLYRHVKMSIKTANILVLAGIILLLFCMGFVVAHNGFTVTFDTNGGSYVESVKVMHGETVPPPETPVKEGFVFQNWYLDRDCTQVWDMEADTATDSFTLFAGWIPKTDPSQKG